MAPSHSTVTHWLLQCGPLLPLTAHKQHPTHCPRERPHSLSRVPVPSPWLSYNPWNMLGRFLLFVTPHAQMSPRPITHTSEAGNYSKDVATEVPRRESPMAWPGRNDKVQSGILSSSFIQHFEEAVGKDKISVWQTWIQTIPKITCSMTLGK